MIKRIPNALTIFRMGLAAPLALALFRENLGWSLGLLLVAGLTDLADGFVARNFNAYSVLGSWLDPAADKLIITTVLVTLTLTGHIPGWFCLITVIRDLGLVAGTLFLKVRGYAIKIKPYLTGKLATVMQNVTLLVAILQSTFSFGTVLWICLLVSATVTVISAVAYAQGFWRVYRGQ